ncbi:hypothetical protein QYF61_011050 [Mycteria americana]|uniref:Uncharacterized protein n=1 Tax=Mycteria americana TaxID=33587 RepID=A0AAN7MYA3_MYCAM|nr:hypothetical protein QYF61_011050 [Mycteria americana]
MVGFLGCECTLLAHIQLFTHQYPQVLLRAAFNPFIPQPVLIPGVTLNQVQDLALGLVEPHKVHMGPLLELVQVPLDGNPSLRHVNCTTQLGVICKLAEGALDPTVYVIDEVIKQYWSQYRPLRDTTRRSEMEGERGAVRALAAPSGHARSAQLAPSPAPSAPSQPQPRCPPRRFPHVEPHNQLALMAEQATRDSSLLLPTTDQREGRDRREWVFTTREAQGRDTEHIMVWLENMPNEGTPVQIVRVTAKLDM